MYNVVIVISSNQLSHRIIEMRLANMKKNESLMNMDNTDLMILHALQSLNSMQKESILDQIDLLKALDDTVICSSSSYPTDIDQIH